MILKKYIPIITPVSLLVLVVIVTAVSVFYLTNLAKYDRYDKQDFIDSTAYQAVFLTNDQIYFGHLKNISPDHVILYDVYYVKIDESGAGKLVKLGQIEPHRPKNEMVINREHVLFWENLRSDSPVVQTIRDHNKQNETLK